MYVCVCVPNLSQILFGVINPNFYQGLKLRPSIRTFCLVLFCFSFHFSWNSAMWGEGYFQIYEKRISGFTINTVTLDRDFI